MNKYDDKMASLGCYSLREGSIPVTPEVVRHFERESGYDLPSEYGEFLSAYGCQTPDGYAYFQYVDPYPRGPRGILNVFFGIDPGGGYDILGNLEQYQGRIPSHLLPIADDPGGNIVCLCVRGANRGAVYFWDHNDEKTVGEGKEPGDSNVYKLSDSFDHFIQGLELESNEEDENEEDE